MADQYHLDKLRSAGKVAWNAWRSENPYMPVDFSGANLERIDLTGYELRNANFTGANLRFARLGPGALAWNATFCDADMYQAVLDGADLADANFANADLFQASFREANLCHAKLADCRGGIRQEQIAGSDITHATLPPQLTTLLEKLDNVKHISESARKLFLAVLAACLYCWLTIATTTDVNLITNRISSPLPIIQTAIPIVGFYIVAPLLLLCTYLYFHFYLQKLWEELGTLPAYLQDGRPLHAKVDPWLLNDLVRAHLTRLKPHRPFLSHLQLRISVQLAWWVVPITLFLFWGRYLRKHEWYGTTLHIILLTLSVLAAFALYRLAIATLRGMKREPFHWKQLLMPRRGYKGVAVTIGILVLFTLVSLGAIKGDKPQNPLFARDPGTKKLHLGTDARNRHTWVPRLAGLFGYSLFADLSNQEVSAKKANWTKQNAKDSDSVSGAKLSKTDLRFANFEGAFVSFADLTGTDLTGAYLNRADFTGADLTGIHIFGADFTGAHLSKVYLKRARIDGAKFNEADLTSADLTEALLTGVGDFMGPGPFTGAELTGTHLGGADLTRAFLISAHLTRAHLTAAGLTGANLLGADLSGADLGGADLTRAQLTGANLTGANLTGADLTGADLTGADLTIAYLKYANFRHVRNPVSSQLLDTQNYKQAFYDDDMIKALGLPPDHNQKLAQQQTKELDDTKKSAPKPPSSATPEKSSQP